MMAHYIDSILDMSMMMLMSQHGQIVFLVVELAARMVYIDLDTMAMVLVENKYYQIGIVAADG